MNDHKPEESFSEKKNAFKASLLKGYDEIEQKFDHLKTKVDINPKIGNLDEIHH